MKIKQSSIFVNAPETLRLLKMNIQKLTYFINSKKPTYVMYNWNESKWLVKFTLLLFVQHSPISEVSNMGGSGYLGIDKSMAMCYSDKVVLTKLSLSLETIEFILFWSSLMN